MRTRAWIFVTALLVLGSGFASAQCNPNVYYQVCTLSLPNADLGVPYSETLVASVGNRTATTWSIAAGQLPTGLTLDPVYGTISGTPTAGGLFSFTVQADQGGDGPSTAQQLLTIFVDSPLTITTTSLPNGFPGVAYPAQTLGTMGGLSVPPTWSIVGGQLPPGLSLTVNGIISGVPSTAGQYAFTVQAYEIYEDESSPLIAKQPLSIYIGNPLSITTPSLPVGVVGVSYSQQFTASGSSSGGTQGWNLVTGNLPPGLLLSSNGVLSGTPTLGGSYSFVIGVVDRAPSGGTNTSYGSFTLTITGSGTTITITTGAILPPGSLGVPYSQQIVATGGTPAYAWQLASGALPGGIGLNATTGVLSGTPTAVGNFSFQLVVTDQGGGSGSKAFTLAVGTGPAITTGSVLPGGASGTPYSTTLAATGGATPYSWSVPTAAGNLPPGLVVDPVSGNLSGTPTASGSFTFVAVVTDAGGHTAAKALTINIETALNISTPSPLTNGTVGTVYQLQFTATGGTPAYTWSLTTGTLPAGIVFDPNKGALSGTPTAGGVFNITIGVKDALQSVAKAFQLTIGAPALPTPTITGLPATAPPATQPALGISLGSPYTLDLTGQATLTFTPDSGSDDPAVQFTSGGRSANFQIPAGTTQAVFGSSSIGVQTGTVAGTITITLQFFAAGVDVTPSPAPTEVLKIAAGPPVIVSAKLVSSATGFDLVVVGYSTTREATGATVNLVAATGTTLATSNFTIALTSAFTAWYQSTTSVPFGSQFTLDIPFTVQNATTVIGSLTVTLTNTQGSSAVATATF